MQNYEIMILDLINNSQRQILARPLILGGVPSASGGVGGPPGGFVGWLQQKRVGYDTDEIGTMDTPVSGMSIYDNLNHIRYRIQILEAASGSGGGVTQIIAGTNISISPIGGTGDVTISASGGSGGHTIQDSTTTFTQRTYLKFTGGATIVDDAGSDTTAITISGGASSGTDILMVQVFS